MALRQSHEVKNELAELLLVNAAARVRIEYLKRDCQAIERDAESVSVLRWWRGALCVARVPGKRSGGACLQLHSHLSFSADVRANMVESAKMYSR